MEMHTKWCPGCEKFHEIAAFGSNKSTYDGYTVYCRERNNEIQRHWKKKHLNQVVTANRNYRKRKAKQRDAR